MAFPTLFALGGMTLVVLTRELLGYSDLVINRGLSAGVVGAIAGLQALPLAANMLPFAVLVGALVALGRLGADRELLVLEASGVSARRLVGPVLGFAGSMTALAIAMSVWIGPWASRSIDQKLMDLARDHPAALILPGVVNEFGNWKLTAREVSADGRRLGGVALWFPRFGQTIFAKRAVLEEARGIGRLKLRNGLVIMEPHGKPRSMRFDRMITELPDTIESDFERNDSDRITGMTLEQLEARAADKEISKRNRLETEVEYHRRFALPVATLVFGILVLPLFLIRGQQSRAAGAMLGVVAVVFYYGLVQLGNGLVQSGTLGVAVGAWIPNVVTGLAAIWLLARGEKLSSFGVQRGRDQGLSSSWRSGDDGSSRSKDAADSRAATPADLEPVAEIVPPTTEPGGEDAEPASAAGRLVVRRWALQRYIAGRFCQMVFAAFLVLLAAYLLVDVLERLQWFARYEATPSEAIRFYGYRIPLLASRVLPMSLLVATALTVALLGVQGELMGIRACGIPAARALFPLIVICALIVPVAFWLNDELVPWTNTAADELKNSEIKERRQDELTTSIGDDRRKAVWFGAGRKHFEADLLDPQQGTAQGLTVYELGDDGLPIRRTDASRARHFDLGRWRVEDAQILDIAIDGLTRRDAGRVVDLGSAVPAEIDTMHLSVSELREEIDEVIDGGWDATQLKVDLHVKFAAPLACLVLPALVLFFCVSGPPYPTTAMSLIVSGAIAVLWVLLTGVSASLGYGGALSAPAAGWAPTAVFAAAAGFLGYRLRGSR